MSQDTLPAPASQQPLPSIGGVEKGIDRTFRVLAYVIAWLSAALVLVIVIDVAVGAKPAISKLGTSFLTTDTWDSDSGKYGIKAQILGTLYSSLLALLIATCFGVAVAIFLSEDFLPRKLENVLAKLVELLAAIPSVVYGLWGIYVVIPAIGPTCAWLHEHLGWIPLFSTELSGPGMLPASLVLAIMILPTIAALSRSAIIAVPQRLRDGAIGLGATRWETIMKIVLPTAGKGIFGSVILAFGRALGETMALAMLIGNRNTFSWSLLSPGDTLAALLANSFAEAKDLEINALMFAALVLLGITLIVNVLGSLVIWRAVGSFKGVR